MISELSSDGTEVFFTTSRPTSDTVLGSILLYDLIGDSTWEPVNDPNYVLAPYRKNRNSDLYFIKSDSTGGLNVWRLDDKLGQEQVSNFALPDFVHRYEVSSDSLICFLADSTHPDGELRRVAIELK